MSDEAALLAAIAEHPAEDTPRLMYADWLQEHGRHVRAEFIRVQIEVSRIEQLPRIELNQYVGLFRRNQELIDNHGAELLGPLAAIAGDPHRAQIEFHRGFVSEVTARWHALGNCERVLVELQPQPRIILSDSPSLVAEFFRGPQSSLDELLSGIRTRTDGPLYSFPLAPLAISTRTWTRLDEVDASGCGLGDEHLLSLFQTWSFPVLADLDLPGNGLTDTAVDSLLASSLPQQLKRLILGGNDITDVGAIALAQRWPTGADDRLENLNLRFTNIGQAGQAALLRRFGGRVDLF